MIPLSLLQRQCGDCQACCTAVGVNELGKPSNFKCEHQFEKGCKVYGKHPESCKTYKCIWLEGELDFADRPDQLGVVFHVHEDNGFWLDGHLLPGSEKNLPRIVEIIEKLLVQFDWLKGARLVSPTQVMNVDYPINLKKYPGGQGDGREGTTWLTYDKKLYFLDAPERIKL